MKGLRCCSPRVPPVNAPTVVSRRYPAATAGAPPTSADGGEGAEQRAARMSGTSRPGFALTPSYVLPSVSGSRASQGPRRAHKVGCVVVCALMGIVDHPWREAKRCVDGGTRESLAWERARGIANLHIKRALRARLLRTQTLRAASRGDDDDGWNDIGVLGLTVGLALERRRAHRRVQHLIQGRRTDLVDR
mmetsp:Transcript_17939/g.41403  ORF Transcript_17939/g.41403 Transcript_17939/m.41403 type:complete len:191 (+) Transcript_17939:508-1080(+)